MIRSLQTSAVVLAALSLLSCSRSGGGNPAATAIAPTEFTIPAGEVLTSTVADPATGSSQEALGVYWLERDASDPGIARLSMGRQATALGDVYELSIRPFMTAENLQLISTTHPTPDVTEYRIQFRHPVAMPTDLERPATATKRADLFLFDVQAVVVASGGDQFFDGAVQVNTGLLHNADGYRHLAPLVDLTSLGITDGTNTFPYKLLFSDDPYSALGNYMPTNGGWSGSSLRSAIGYDVVPQGASVETSLRIPDDFAGPVGVVVAAKYMDPRGGVTVDEKRANRLPDPGNFSAFAYALPEACGDLQIISVIENEGLPVNTPGTEGLVKLRVLDWDNAAKVAVIFPNIANLGQIRRQSAPGLVSASIPALDADDLFYGTVSQPTGNQQRSRNVTIKVVNQDLEPASEAYDVPGFIQILDTQDMGTAPIRALNEQQLAVDAGPYLNARYQFVRVPILPPVAAVYTGPSTVEPGKNVEFTVELTGNPIPATSYAWDFDGATIPGTSNNPSPTLKAVTVPGMHVCNVRVTQGTSYVDIPFPLTVAPPLPTLPAELYDYTPSDLPRHFTDLSFPRGVIATSDNTPLDNITSDAGATLGRVLFYDTRLSKNYTISCASCHKQSLGFADATPVSKGFNGGFTSRNAMGLANCRYYFGGRMFADERAASLEELALMPIQDEVEMGLSLPELEDRLTNTAFYRPLFEDAFGDSTVSSDRVAKALAQFLRSIVSYRSKYDEAMTAGPGDTPDFIGTFTPEEFTGLAVFEGVLGYNVKQANCVQCHATGVQTMGAAANPSYGTLEGPFRLNNGLTVAYYEPETNETEFKAPSLRNIALTAPYMHDGRFATLEEVVDFYSFGVSNHPGLHRFLREGDEEGAPAERLNLNQEEKDGLLAFLHTLTDEPLRDDPRYSDPFHPSE